MKAAERIKHKLSQSTEKRSSNAKYSPKRWKINLNSLMEYVHYVRDDGLQFAD